MHDNSVHRFYFFNDLEEIASVDDRQTIDTRLPLRPVQYATAISPILYASPIALADITRRWSFSLIESLIPIHVETKPDLGS
jgi:hypothetical protein